MVLARSEGIPRYTYLLLTIELQTVLPMPSLSGTTSRLSLLFFSFSLLDFLVAVLVRRNGLPGKSNTKLVCSADGVALAVLIRSAAATDKPLPAIGTHECGRWTVQFLWELGRPWYGSISIKSSIRI